MRIFALKPALLVTTSLLLQACSDQSPASCPTCAWRSVAVPTTTTLFAVSGSAPDDVWAVGDHGAIIHWDGDAWSAVTSPTTATLFGVWAGARDSAWLVGDDGVMSHWDGTAWGSPTLTPGGAPMTDVFGLSPNDVWAVGSYIMHSSGGSFGPGVALPDAALAGVWLADSTHGWAVGDKSMLAWDGSGWHSVPAPVLTTYFAVHGSSISDVWAVGDKGAVSHANGAAWTPQTVPSSESLLGVWASSATNAWIVGDHGVLLHLDGSTWTSTTSPTPNALFGAWGTSPDDVWAVGDHGTVLHFTEQ